MQIKGKEGKKLQLKNVDSGGKRTDKNGKKDIFQGIQNI